MSRSISTRCVLAFILTLFAGVSARAQTITATVGGVVTDTSGAVVPKAKVTATNTSTGFSRSDVSSDTGEYRISLLPVGDYTVTAELTGFQKQVKKVTLQIGQVATLDFVLAVGEVTQKAVVEAEAEVLEPTRTQISTVITRQQIKDLPVNGRQFIDFALLAPAVQIGDTTSGSTDVIVEPVTKLSFAGQNIHYNFIAVDGADDISTASGIQRATPAQESVQEFRVINTNYTTEFGRAVGGIVNIITRSGTNDWHGSLYDYFRNNALDAKNILQAPGLNILRQNQFGASIGGPVQKDKTFVFLNYEGQRRGESPFYNSAVLNNIAAINNVKVNVFGLPPEPAGLNVLRAGDIDNGFGRIDHNFSGKHYLFARYFVTDGRLTNQSPLNDGFDLPSAFKNNAFRDQSIVGSLTSIFSTRFTNEARVQFARRSFDFTTATTQPHLEVSNTFTVGVNRGNPDFYREQRFELVDNFTINRDKHTISFGGNFNFVRTQESFPLFYPFEADFLGLGAFLGTDGFVMSCPTAPACPHPFVIFFERFQAPNFTEPTFNTAVFKGTKIATAIRNQAEGTLDHTYDGFFIQDKWRPTNRLTLNAGLRYEFETWPSAALNNDMDNFDPRLGLAYNLGTSRNVVVRAGFGIFHGIIPAPLLMCQIPSCGGTRGAFPGQTNEDSLNSTTRLFAFGSAPGIMNPALNSMLGGTYLDAAPLSFCPGGVISGCGLFGDAVIVRFAKNHQAPYGIQTSLSVEFEPMRDTVLSVTGLHVRGVHLGSFFNINQPIPSAQVVAHDSNGRSGPKNTYFAAPFVPGVQPINPPFAVYFEADSRWDSVYDGLLVNLNKRLTHHFSYGISYTWAHSIDDGPNPSFVLIPQDSRNFRAERASSADDVRHRFVGNAIFSSPSTWNILARDFLLSWIVTLQSPQYFTKFAGFDANGDVFGNNDRVGIEPRNTFKGDTLQTVDVRFSRAFPIREKMKLDLAFEAFNLLNKVNVRFFNTAYNAADFCPFNPIAQGCQGGPFPNREGSPSNLYGTPRAVFNPRQLQLSFRFTF
jgi:hypothetical protein